ncbi:retropepsin-like aspartic protease [Armatimonas rosea]|uniref:Putative aspartyl protease n=1 Tax=Armatimonas rosea TaxID=685828 RepID=A0A7W9W6I6_ARMRO|nr:retropepsin-like aspartic protease [Armatimonas rosea]MBB6050221.1 putative aspartyl protease [Armatimonas rosea]
MTALRLESGLLFVSLKLRFAGREEMVYGALLDTGSASTVITAHVADRLGIEPASTDSLRRLQGIGGAEWVYTKQIESLQVGLLFLNLPEIEVSGSDYGFGIEAILGTDFLLSVGAVLDLRNLTISAL